MKYGKRNFIITLIQSLCFFFLSVVFSQYTCEEVSPLPNPESAGNIVGTVFSVGWPGPIPENWEPPRYLQKCTIILLDSDKRPLKEFSTNNDGSFQTEAIPGTYYFLVKESPIPSETGPYSLKDSQTLSVQAHYDNGMR